MGSGRKLFVSVLGWSNSGKTTLIVRALEECARRGIPAAAIKRARHDPDVAPEGKDSTLYLEAGALASVYVGDRTSARYERSPAVQDLAYFESMLPSEAALAFLEGAAVEGAVVVLAAGGASSLPELKRPAGECSVLIADDPSLREAAAATGILVLASSEIAKLIDYLEAKRGA
jgi:molybdopterin-guanine dinucleotide biosynthesis protein MobB